ncbi:hypothetical protein AB4865_02060 [Capnocytophaga sp. ARDL2]|uniref:glycosyltransferase family protein n=1 Tax=Capnocytophaga sp. ARDL2 TaxID=3238809 RepID=UPI0035565F0C
MNIGITLIKQDYTPEAFAYQLFLEKKGHIVQLDYKLDPNNDINIYFMGLRPFYQKKKKALEIHEYQSLSTPPYCLLKDSVKKIFNKKPNGRIFLNNFVYNQMQFKDNIPFIKRDMGVDENLFQSPSKNPLYDIVYSGSILGREGLIKVIQKLAKFYKILVIGQVTNYHRQFLNHENIYLTGRVERKFLPELYREARYGLNFIPNLRPFNMQTSTKVLEYLASGLQVISNRYSWMENFCKTINYEPIWFDDLDFLSLKHYQQIPSMNRYKWENILTESYFEQFLVKLLNK